MKNIQFQSSCYFKNNNFYLVADRIKVTEVVSNSRYRSMFRHLSRESSGETYDPPDGNKLFFAHEFSLCTGDKVLLGVASYKPRNPNQSSREHEFHELTYLFVDSLHQGKGVGKKLLTAVEKHAQKVDNSKPVKLESAKKAVGFFEKFGYTVTGEPKECITGSNLFRKIIPMEKSFKMPVSSTDWPDSTEDNWGY